MRTMLFFFRPLFFLRKSPPSLVYLTPREVAAVLRAQSFGQKLRFQSTIFLPRVYSGMGLLSHQEIDLEENCSCQHTARVNSGFVVNS